MSRVLVGQAYFLRFDPKVWAAMQPYPPLGSLYACAVLRERGHDVAFFDAMLAESEAGWSDAMARTRPEYAVLFEDNFNYLSKMCLLRMREAAGRMIAAARRQGATVIVGGSDATDHGGHYLAAGADFVLHGEGELSLAELLDDLESDPSAVGAIAGVSGRDAESGRTWRSRDRPPVTDLDALPMPAWDLVDLDPYRRRWRARHGRFSLNMVTTRGCPYHCNWCAKPIWGQRYAVRTPGHVVRELEWLQELANPDHVSFSDDIFGLQPGWIRTFADLVNARGLRRPFKCLSRADLLLRDGEVEALARAGCEMVWLGAESGSQKILDAMEKGLRVEQIVGAAHALKRAGIAVGFFLQFGYPGETRGDIDRTFDLVRACEPDDIGASVSYPLPNTRFFERVQASLGQRRNWVQSDDLAMLYRGAFPTAFYRQLHEVLHKEFRLQRATRRLWRAGRPDTGAKARLRDAATATYHWATIRRARRRLEALAVLEHEEGPHPLGCEAGGVRLVR